jgi:hypothetical protein
LELSSEIEAALCGFPKWKPEASGGILRLRNESDGLVLTIKRLPFCRTAVSGEIRLDAPSGVSVLNLATGKDVPNETLERHLWRLGFGSAPVMPLLTKLLPIIRNFLLLEVPEG